MTANLMPEPAAVRPRVALAGGTAARLLDEEIGELLARGTPQNVQLVGPPGSGRSTALRHLAARFGADQRLGLRDSDGTGNDGSLVTVTARAAPTGRALVLQLLPWSDDDVLEYLLAAHRDRTAAVLALWRGDPFAQSLGRWPGMCRSVIDDLAARRAGDVFCALRQLCERELPGDALADGRAVALRHSTVSDCSSTHTPEGSTPLLAAPAVRALLAAEQLISSIEADQLVELSRLHFSALLLAALRREVPDDAEREARLLQRSGRPEMPSFAACLSVLCAARPGFRPPVLDLGDVEDAYLAGADLRQCRLRGLHRANLTAADLRGADLFEARASFTRLGRARLQGARLDRAQLQSADAAFLHARCAHLPRANLRHADLHHAVLDGADLTEAVMAECHLDDASLQRADLARAHLMGSSLQRTDLRGARCAGATFAQLDLRTVLLEGADLDRANLSRTDLSGTTVPRLQARHARFDDAQLTGAVWPGAQLRGAHFAGAGLAGIDFESADLRLADFSNATFQFGGSRSGLVGSPIAGEGSRTGFYTDESLEDRFLAPEAVRKANLRCCDLRGAHVEDCDFYLVDLRGARLDAGQVEWLRRCRAILDREPLTD